jgi:transcription-repair coupling factor (superfamily II helicase)
LCTTIIESGIDVPSANTIVIHRADKLGLAQLHQLRGRVGRSHHRAYAYLITPPPTAMIEAGPSGGRLLFAPDTTIDPTRLIKLIQTRPKEYKLDGGDKLRFFRDLADPAQHIEQVGRVVEQLVG